MCNGQFKVFQKIGIYSMASCLLPLAKWGEGGSLWVNRSGKLPRNGHFMFLQHLRSSRLTFTFGKGPESNGKLQQLAMLVTQIRRHISFLKCSCHRKGGRECKRRLNDKSAKLSVSVVSQLISDPISWFSQVINTKYCTSAAVLITRTSGDASALRHMIINA